MNFILEVFFMLYPAIGGLLEKAKTRYGLVIAVSKRARELSDMDTVQTSSLKPVSVAVREIAEGNVIIDEQE
jgi:DNA-directed RNA polymerase subunit omega